MINKLCVLLTLFLLPITQADRREIISEGLFNRKIAGSSKLQHLF